MHVATLPSARLTRGVVMIPNDPLHKLAWSRRQKKQAPHDGSETGDDPVTDLDPVTAEPTASTTPAPSWPSTMGPAPPV